MDLEQPGIPVDHRLNCVDGLGRLALCGDAEMKKYRVYYLDGETDDITGRLTDFNVSAHEATFITRTGLLTLDHVENVEVLS